MGGNDGRVYLDVAFEEKDAAKALGAKWDRVMKKWYVPSGVDLDAFERWVPITEHRDVDSHVPTYHMESPCIYLVLADRACPKCGGMTKVAAFGIPYDAESDNMSELEAYNWYFDCGHRDLTTTDPCGLALEPALGCYPAEIRSYLERECNFKWTYSRSPYSTGLRCTCPHCGMLQGDHFLFEEPGAPFFPVSAEDVARLSFVRVEVPGVYGILSAPATNDSELMAYALGHSSDFGEKVRDAIYLP